LCNSIINYRFIKLQNEPGDNVGKAASLLLRGREKALGEIFDEEKMRITKGKLASSSSLFKLFSDI
jgi:hypothetical protein